MFVINSDFPEFVRIKEREQWFFTSKRKKRQLIEYYEKCKKMEPCVRGIGLMQLEYMFKHKRLL